jgi:uncharacterized protein YndB with AHSA1/START domain
MSKLQHINIVQEFDVPVAQLFAKLSEHENLNQIFAPAKVKRLKDGNDSRNGVGSVRQIILPLAPAVEETNTAYVENKLIEYTITSKGGPIKNHYGTMNFIDLGNRSRLEYHIQFAGRLPLVGLLVKLALQDGIQRGLKKMRF